MQPINGDPFIGMLETPVTSAPIVASFLSNLPAYRTGVSPLLRGVEIGLVHGFFLTGEARQQQAWCLAGLSAILAAQVASACRNCPMWRKELIDCAASQVEV